MQKILQSTNATHYDRYPNIFSFMSDVITMKVINENKPVMNILSFGCSFGEEVKSFEEIYFKNHNINGVDINQECINRCKSLGIKSGFYTVNEFKEIKEKYDVVFCMSVLCTMLHSRFEHPIDFSDFNNTCIQLDERINIGGYFVDFNSNYYFLDSDIGNKYIPITNHRILKSNEQTIKYKPDGKNVMEENSVCVFKKVK